METKLELINNKIKKSFLILFFVIGVLFIIQGIINIYERNDFFYYFAWIRFSVGLSYIIYVILVFRNSFETPFIKLSDSELSFKLNPFRRNVFLSFNDISKIEVSKQRLVINSKNKNYKLNLYSLGYNQRINELPRFLEQLENFKVEHSIK